MGKSSKKDFISGLPQSIIEIILTKLQIRDAVRTSILARKWRYQWATMTQLVFDSGRMSLSDDRQVAEKEIANFIARFLLLHDGPIDKFRLLTLQSIRFDDLDQWLLFLSRKDIKELVLRMYGRPVDYRLYRTPSCIFSCQKLIKLELMGFEVKPPVAFQGFPCLKYLSLSGGEVTLEVIENLISDCPLLETFKLFTSSKHALTVRASKLKHLTLGGDFKDVYLEHTPLLVTVSISLQDWEGNVLLKVPATYDCLKVISLEGITFQDMNQCSYVLQLLLQSPNLQELEIEAGSVRHVDDKAVDLDFWKRVCPADFTFKHLKEVNMLNLSDKYDLEFLKFVLGRSPVVEVMIIFIDMDSNEKMNMADKVLQCVRASPKVDITVHV